MRSKEVVSKGDLKMRSREEDWQLVKKRCSGLAVAMALEVGIGVLGMHTGWKDEFLSAGAAVGMFLMTDVTGVRKLSNRFAIAASVGAVCYGACVEQNWEFEKIHAQKVTVANCLNGLKPREESHEQRGVSHLQR
jgi:hypothetical protein